MDDKPAVNLYTALLAAMRDFAPVVKNATNPHLKSKYADLGAVLDAVAEPLANHGLLLLQRFTHDQGGAILVTELVHAASGERLTSEVPVVSKDPTDPQKIGAAITYYRRYSLLALLGLAPEDDDGHTASHPARQSRTPNTSVQAPRPAPQPPAPAGTPYTKQEYDAVIDEAWGMAEDDQPLGAIKDMLNKCRHRMTQEQRKEAMGALTAIAQKYYTPAVAA